MKLSNKRRLEELEDWTFAGDGAAWEAYGLLLERGFGMIRWAAHLYESGQFERLRRLWVELAEDINRSRPTDQQLEWAVGRMPYMIGRWEEQSNPLLPRWADMPDPAGYATLADYLEAHYEAEH